ncbi:hypothetical protein N657DRAFT_639336 [Parathielavia appendiculata]|uniref:Uncharacterized protein n=1 Tax=Parathielavia appendiculata TaxID=2587402 RepID=A0AAN6Z8S6_9PEZI|nr:hypothetical protein N657DRAFT_639336 [Parathielavia appendiculata]
MAGFAAGIAHKNYIALVCTCGNTRSRANTFSLRRPRPGQPHEPSRARQFHRWLWEATNPSPTPREAQLICESSRLGHFIGIDEKGSRRRYLKEPLLTSESCEAELPKSIATEPCLSLKLPHNSPLSTALLCRILVGTTRNCGKPGPLPWGPEAGSGVKLGAFPRRSQPYLAGRAAG